MHSTEDDSDAEGGKHVVGDEEEEGDFLEDFPDETTVRSTIYNMIHCLMALQELELLHSRISSLGGLRLGRFAATLTKLGLRQNFISFLDPDIFSLLSNLEELDLYDNKVKTVGDALNNLSRLRQAALGLPVSLIIDRPRFRQVTRSVVQSPQGRSRHFVAFDLTGNGILCTKSNI